MGISIQQMRDYVWSYFELDAEDLPPSLLDRWAEEGWTRVYRHVKRWPHYESDEQIVTEAGQPGYTSTLDQVHSIYGPDGQLKWMEQTEAQRFFDTAGTPDSPAKPQAWSTWGGDLRLWPTPDAEYTLTAFGWRPPSAFTALGAGTEPDLPEDFHQLVLSWVMHRCYQHQDDFDGTQLELSEFRNMLDILTTHETQAPTSAPVSFGGNRKRRGLPSRLRYEWE